MRNLIRLFLDTVRSDLKTIKTHVEGGKPNELSRSLHRLKGGCGTIGATAMGNIASEMEARLPDGGTEGQALLLKSLETEFGSTERYLLKKLESF